MIGLQSSDRVKRSGTEAGDFPDPGFPETGILLPPLLSHANEIPRRSAVTGEVQHSPRLKRPSSRLRPPASARLEFGCLAIAPLSSEAI
jgi:hypothetical protein